MMDGEGAETPNPRAAVVPEDSKAHEGSVVDMGEDAKTNASTDAVKERGKGTTTVCERDLDLGVGLAAAATTQVFQQEDLIPAATQKSLSKNQLKKRRRWERAMEKKKRRKQQEKEMKMAKALAQGRDLDEERRLQSERTKAGIGRKIRDEKWLERMKTADSSFQVCIDCAYDSQLTEKEMGSLASQIRYCYSVNRRSRSPIYLSVADLRGQTRELLDRVEGFPDLWSRRAFQCSDKSLIEMHPNKEKLVYLTSDSEHTLEHLEDTKIYIIGGIVDRNRLKRAAITRAESLGVATAKLPIADYLQIFSTKVLTCNHVFEILLKYRQFGNSWKKAMLDVLPVRKEAKAKDGDKCELVEQEKVDSSASTSKHG